MRAHVISCNAFTGDGQYLSAKAGIMGIVLELTDQKRNRLHAYTQSMDVMNQGNELPK
jgi:hypothetical protein